MTWIALGIIAAALLLGALGIWAEYREAVRVVYKQPDPIDSHFEQALTACGADEACLRALAGASFGPKASVVLPSGRRLSGDEAQALAAFYAPAAEVSR